MKYVNDLLFNDLLFNDYLFDDRLFNDHFPVWVTLYAKMTMPDYKFQKSIFIMLKPDYFYLRISTETDIWELSELNTFRQTTISSTLWSR